MVQSKSMLMAFTALLLSSQVSADPCSSLLNSTFKDVTINIATTIIAGSNFTGETESIYNTLLTSLPEHCRVAASVKTSNSSFAGFELWMPPTTSWNRRFLATGNGGWAGAVNYPDIQYGLDLNFATMSTDTGHNSSSGDGTWGGNWEANVDFAKRAMHASIVASKEILTAYYSEAESWSYYAGCSTGGRQGWVEAQLYPDDFDGVLVGSPVIAQTKLEAWEIHVGNYQYPNTSDTFISADDWTVIHEEVLRQCDGLDGVVDGLVSDPFHCNFIPETLLCKENKTSSCLTPPQVANLKYIYSPWYEANSTLVFNGIEPGSELTGIQAYTNSASQGGFGLDFYRYQIMNDTGFQAKSLTYADILLAAEVIPEGSDGVNPDLRPMQSKGSKIIHYHGLQDSIVPPKNSQNYYQSVLNNMTNVQDFYRLFVIPGMGHCSGGDGAWAIGTPNQVLTPATNDTDYSLLLSLVNWVEAGQAPEYVVGTAYLNATEEDGIDFTRPACLWPEVPKYLGGDVNDASSWACPKIYEF